MRLNKYMVYTAGPRTPTLTVTVVATSAAAIRKRMFPWLIAGGFERAMVLPVRTSRTHRTEDLFRKLYPVLEGTEG